jgi:hypothetical protein
MFAFVLFVPLCGYFFRVVAAFFADRERDAAERVLGALPSRLSFRARSSVSFSGI